MEAKLHSRFRVWSDRRRTVCTAPLPCSLASARRFVERVARDWGLDEERTFGLKVAVSEACANALEHGHTSSQDLEVTACSVRSRLTVSVRGSGSFRPPATYLGREFRGWGMPFMIALTDELTISRGRDGNTVVMLTVLRRPSRLLRARLGLAK